MHVVHTNNTTCRRVSVSVSISRRAPKFPVTLFIENIQCLQKGVGATLQRWPREAGCRFTHKSKTSFASPNNLRILS